MKMKMNKVNPKDLPELIQEMIEHYKHSNSFAGFLMTLKPEEVTFLADRLEAKDDAHGVMVLIAHYKGLPEEGTEFTHEEIEGTLAGCMADLTLVETVKEGYMTAEMPEDGGDNWTYHLTEKGEEEAKRMLDELFNSDKTEEE